MIATIALAIALAAAPTATTLAPPTAPTHADTVFPRGLPHAPHLGECYSSRCVWDGKHQGDGTGQSFIQTRFHDYYIAQPISHQRAHRLQAGWCDRPSVTCDGYED